MNIATLYLVWILLLVFGIPLGFDLVPPGRFIGFRTATSLIHTETWRRTNIFAGWSLVIAAAIGTFITILVPDFAHDFGQLLVVGLLTVSVVATFGYLSVIKKRHQCHT